MFSRQDKEAAGKENCRNKIYSFYFCVYVNFLLNTLDNSGNPYFVTKLPKIIGSIFAKIS